MLPVYKYDIICNHRKRSSKIFFLGGGGKLKYLVEIISAEALPSYPYLSYHYNILFFNRHLFDPSEIDQTNQNK